MMANRKRVVIGGVDTHGLTHHAAVLDEQGRLLADAEFTADTVGYRRLTAWLRRHGNVVKVGVEGTGSYGAGLAAHLLEQGITVLEVDRPDRRTRRRRGKSDAEAAARAVLCGTATALPRSRHGVIESIRALRIARSGAVKARTAAINSLKSLLVTAPATLRESLAGKSSTALVTACTLLTADGDLTDATAGVETALSVVAHRITQLDTEIAVADTRLARLLTTAAPNTMALKGIGPEHAGQLLTTAGANPERLRGEAAFAHLCGVAPIPASSGKTNRHRLHRGGDRGANRALHLAIVVRIRYCPRTRAYITRRTAEGLTKPDIIRCLKRYLAREVYHAIKTDYQALHHP
jgi:transposase